MPAAKRKSSGPTKAAVTDARPAPAQKRKTSTKAKPTKSKTTVTRSVVQADDAAVNTVDTVPVVPTSTAVSGSVSEPLNLELSDDDSQSSADWRHGVDLSFITLFKSSSACRDRDNRMNDKIDSLVTELRTFKTQTHKELASIQRDLASIQKRLPELDRLAKRSEVMSGLIDDDAEKTTARIRNLIDRVDSLEEEIGEHTKGTETVMKCMTMKAQVDLVNTMSNTMSGNSMSDRIGDLERWRNSLPVYPPCYMAPPRPPPR